MPDRALTITFLDGTSGERNKHAQALLEHLKEAVADESVVVSRERDARDAMDLGGTLAIVAMSTATSVVIEVAGKALAEVLKDYVETWYARIRVQSQDALLEISKDTPLAAVKDAIQSGLARKSSDGN